MASVLVLLNPLDSSRRRRLVAPAGVPLLDWLDSVEPAAGHLQRQVYVRELLCVDRSYRTRDEDEVLVTFAPGAANVAELVAQAIVAYVIGYALNQLFAPKRPQAGTLPAPSQVYGIAPPQNQARLGQPIPVIYGSVVALPDFAAQPYTFFDSNNDQWMHAVLCAGLGDIDVSEILFADTSGVPIPPGVVQWRAFKPAEHFSRFGTIYGQTGVRENVVTSPAVGTQELLGQLEAGLWIPPTFYWALSNVTTSSVASGVALYSKTTPTDKLALLPASPSIGTVVACTVAFDGNVSSPTFTLGNYTATAYTPSQALAASALLPASTYSTAAASKWVGPFDCCKAGQTGTSIELDFVFPGGLYGTSAGAIAQGDIILQINWDKVDNSGNVIAGGSSTQLHITGTQTTPKRMTWTQAVASGRYRVQIAQLTNGNFNQANVSTRCIWAGLKFQLDPPPAGTVTYGNVTLIAVALRASNGVAEDAAASMRFRVTRRLAPLGSGATAPTSNPADIFTDIVTAPYGGNRPLSADELDLTELTNSRSLWASASGFNGVFDQASTVWEALTLSVQTVNAAPLPIGSRMSLIHDGTQAVRTQLFTDANIVAGSLAVTEGFDVPGTPAGVRVTYRDPTTFDEQSVYNPAGAPDYQTVDLFGCTDATVAAQVAQLAQNKRAKQRTSITFATELEGLNCLPGDRIGVAAGMVKWAQSARVASIRGPYLVLDHALDWSAGGPWAIQLRDPTGTPTQKTDISRGTADNEIYLASPPPFTLTAANVGGQEATTLSFGVQNSEVTDWTVLKITPAGATVTIEARNYDASIYSGMADYVQFGLPPESLEEVVA
jgi:hypothetical protein